MNVEAYYHEYTHSLTYLVWHPKTLDAAVIDPVLDYEPGGSKVSTEFIQRVISDIEGKGLKLRLTMETHAHADHITASGELKRRFPDVITVIGAHIIQVQETFKEIYNLGEAF